MVEGYMCRTDFEDELGTAAGGTRVFSSEADLRETLKCAASCGIVKVRVEFVEVVDAGTAPWREE